MASDARNVFLTGVKGFIVVNGSVPHQRTRRDVRMYLTPETILQLAAAITTCPAVKDKDGKLVNIPHAIWHFNNPDEPAACPIDSHST
jgi:hypothetical protein